MPRPEREVDPDSGPVALFAAQLREMRRAAGGPGYRLLAERSGYSMSTLADAAGGRRLPSLAVTLAFVRACGGDVVVWEPRWQQTARLMAARVTDSEARAPYRGLASYDVGDADLFFGRRRLVEQLTRMLREQSFVAAFGVSGSGKSSLLRAGLVPAMATQVDETGRSPVIVTPGADPVVALHSALETVPADRNVLLIVDQFEELFTLCADPIVRGEFVAGLAELAARPGADNRVVIGVRADFYARCTELPDLATLLAEASVPVPPLNDDELREAITKPAHQAGLTVERALVTKILADAGGQSGALPLVSHALLETWRQRRGDVLTVAGYEATGGVAHAIAQTAEAVYTGLDHDQQQTVRQTLTRLVALAEGGQDTRRRVHRGELDFPAVDKVLETLAAARLVVLDDDTVEVAHEALISAWPRLRTWLTADREALRTHRQLIEAAAMWHSLDRDAGALYRGTRLAIVQEWAEEESHLAGLNRGEREFLDESVSAAFAERTAVGRRARQRRVLTAALAGLLVLSVVAGAVATWQWRSALGERQQAVSRQFAIQSSVLASTDVAEELRLGLEAYQAAPTVEARGALLSAASRIAYTGRLDHSGMVKDVVFSPDGRQLATAGQDGRIVLWDVADRARRQVLTGHDAAVRSLAYGPDGRWLVSGSLNGTVIVWDLQQHAEIRRLHGMSGLVDSVAVSPDGTLVAAVGQDHRIMLWRVADGAGLGELAGHGGEFSEVAFCSNSQVVSAGDDGTAVVWDLGNRVRSHTLRASAQAVYTVACSHDGRTAAVAGEDRAVTIWDTGTGERRRVMRDHSNSVRALAFSPDDATLVSAGYDGTAMVWDVRRGQRLITLTGHTSALYAVAFSPDGRTIASGSRDRTVLLWDREHMPMAGHVDEVNAVAVAPDGRAVASASKDDTVVVWDPATAAARTVAISTPPALAVDRGAAAIEYSPDGQRLLVAYRDQTARIWDTTSGRLIHTLTGHTDRLLTAAFHPEGRTAVTGGLDRTTRIWDTERGTTVATLPHEAQVQSVAFSRDGTVLLTATQDGVLTLWNTSNWTARRVVHDEPGLISAALNLELNLIAVGRADGTTALWSTTGVAVLSGHTGPVNSLAFHPGNRFLATASLDQTIRIWDLSQRQTWAALTGSAGGVSDITWSTADQHLYSVGGDHTVTRWITDPDTASHHVCENLAHRFPAKPRPGSCSSAR
ncbi:hypothetical protein FKR81_20560 [Lentzea tibetensis]|uniref:Novel STAND NTPase 1 domain-containing protein n=1 Tax=Lentzea tibetensis TaxID=2591470 RepID=A0A563ESD9_9PSEU|nr:hypothetical protein [Lentzea tibetensis]TWP50560.1 hypothetical protein FKR81_20560 [Lentzea tibetensis]